jgi:small subunit ribosomal protein S1
MASNQDEQLEETAAWAEEDDLDQLIDDYSHLAPPAQGELLRGHVLSVTPTEVIVDFGYKSEGIVPIAQFTLHDGSVHVKAGDEIDVMVERHSQPIDGYIVLSHERALRVRAWDNLEKAFREALIVSGRVMRRTKGGLGVDVGIEAFLPASHIDLKPIHDLDSFVGKDIPVKILKLNRRRGNVVVSRRHAVEEE